MLPHTQETEENPAWARRFTKAEANGLEYEQEVLDLAKGHHNPLQASSLHQGERRTASDQETAGTPSRRRGAPSTPFLGFWPPYLVPTVLPSWPLLLLSKQLVYLCTECLLLFISNMLPRWSPSCDRAG